MLAARPISGLPTYGPPALSFPDPNAFSEGYVVEFTTEEGESWVGNFAGWDNAYPSLVCPELGTSGVVVVAGGNGFVIDANKRALIRELGFVNNIWFVEELRAFVAATLVDFYAFNADALHWTSRRISWDGLRNIERVGLTMKGEAFDVPQDRWLPFTVDLTSGEVAGGSETISQQQQASPPPSRG